ncbi:MULTISPECIES: HNH endonuclease [unclassified Variovorax]|uniref:HNH endonuclease n=1 Tax=unclassified Variovorax TaxID=663243 RepID=UPI0008390AC6|nr:MULTISPECIES: HNH endonuclease [unclassified Variovorax]PNG50074.1 CRISPR-associated endonuclease Cas9 [Variovorax sp. B2]PNG50946.1 CRISPR-associated endonuclease Cas9 [Variovorax sp. B4]VTU41693.1 HNH endonuclease [Variovorax sp. SRS16]VTU41733.1 HNH endonuclease [Variovorax sp. PBL-E5]VTU44693.1 HNH endonuclease [Variovorax sp. PBL-H6]
MEPRILAVDRAYTPDRWIGAAEALNLFSRGIVQTSFGDVAMTLRGGMNAKTGKQSILEVHSILVVDSKSHVVTDFNYAPLDRRRLFKRDLHICAYCGERFSHDKLEAEHVTPDAQGGAYSWENLVSACHPCNQRKGCRTPEQAGMPLLYLPYRPSRFESLILESRNILASQADFLLARVPKHSRLHS